MRKEFIKAIFSHQHTFGVRLSERAIERLADHYELVLQHNPLLHLVAPCPADEFATRHVLESLMLLDHLPQGAKFVDVGAGAGLPSIPCLIARDDLHAELIESKEKKARFLNEAIALLGLSERANAVNRQFQETIPGDAGFVTCRALDKFTEKLPKLIKWGKGRGLLFFGGPVLGSELKNQGLEVEKRLLPLSEKRYLFISRA